MQHHRHGTSSDGRVEGGEIKREKGENTDITLGPENKERGYVVGLQCCV
jgi:hypothetical protein